MLKVIDYVEEVDFVNSEHDDELVIFLIQILWSCLLTTKKSRHVNFYCHFNNIETDIEQTPEDAYNETLHDVEKFDEISNLCESSEEEFETEHNQFVRAILYAMRFDKINEKEICLKKTLKKVSTKSL